MSKCNICGSTRNLVLFKCKHEICLVCTSLCRIPAVSDEKCIFCSPVKKTIESPPANCITHYVCIKWW